MRHILFPYRTFYILGTKRVVLALFFFLFALFTGPLYAQDIFEVKKVAVAEEKAVYATVESKDVIQARARIGGTVGDLQVDEGAFVEHGQTLAFVGDEKLVLEIQSLEARAAGLAAELNQARIDLGRVKPLVERGVLPRARLDESNTAVSVLERTLESLQAEKSVIEERLQEGEIRAPATGRVIKVPVTQGSVILPGEPVAVIARQNFVLRLRLPERHAGQIQEGDPVRLGGGPFTHLSGDITGYIEQVYPNIEKGHVIADARVEGLGDYFLGERVQVWIKVGERSTFVIPQDYISTQYGIDYVYLQAENGEVLEVPVQIGTVNPDTNLENGIKVLSGLRQGDVLVRP